MQYCPKCKEEYEDGIEKCADCGGKLEKGGLVEEKIEKELLQTEIPNITEVYRTLDEKDAEEKTFYLKKHEINSTVFQHIVPITNERLEVFGPKVFFRIVVGEDVAQHARELLQEMLDKNIKISEEELDKANEREQDWTCSRCGRKLESADSVCEFCDKELDVKICSMCNEEYSGEECPNCKSE